MPFVTVTQRFRCEGGGKMVEVAQMTFSLEKHADGWKIAAFTWTGRTRTARDGGGGRMTYTPSSRASALSR